ncbi:MAG TPA: hypothetical protein VGL77_02610 [Armatimonadota bacterium]|jgi:hypothetical protein
MNIRSFLVATFVIGGSMAFAQVCPPASDSTVLVPSRDAQANSYVLPSSTVTSTTVVPYGSGPMVSTMPGTVMMPMPSTTMSMVPPANMSPDTASIVNQIIALRSDVHALQGQVYAAALELRGQQLVSRVNELMANEMLFRQQIAANPTLPNAQATSLQLSAQADALNRDLASFNRELSLIPADQRPYLAQQLNAFTVAYWDPTMQNFAAYRTQFTTNATAYQPAYASNAWLQPWVANYQTSLDNLAAAPQNYASVSWWSETRVLGTSETYPGTMMSLPQGAVIYIPANTASTMGLTSTGTTGTMGMTTSTGTTTTMTGPETNPNSPNTAGATGATPPSATATTTPAPDTTTGTGY